MARENPLPDRPRLLDKKVVFTHENQDVVVLLGLILGEFGKLHLEWRSDATRVEAKRRARRSTAAGSSGTNSLGCCASSNTSRKVQRSFFNRTFPVCASRT